MFNSENHGMFYWQQERPRPEYTARCPTMERNPVTGVREPHFPARDRLPRMLSGVGAIIIMVSTLCFT